MRAFKESLGNDFDDIVITAKTEHLANPEQRAQIRQIQHLLPKKNSHSQRNNLKKSFINFNPYDHDCHPDNLLNDAKASLILHQNN
ncbi:MAG: hypothetical protein GY821_15925 [Gammaproteobacteria bacterium]|nr:hypothetical protein [Gammaproteobacteria bacterium]